MIKTQLKLLTLTIAFFCACTSLHAKKTRLDLLLEQAKPKAALVVAEVSKQIKEYQNNKRDLAHLYKPIPAMLGKFANNPYIFEPYLPLMRNKNSAFYQNLKIRLKPNVRKKFEEHVKTLLREEQRGNG